ncbi:hypothetical protein CDL15_Pgr010760 [Punica granatum]|uniref:Uncharacterized protein n=1 Tax=Punica granatum TaxID=22663 RepID=A0A218W6V5_PUNGR|nr:hypothetical protein CDL15_Pgr010760 [Punica granatum]
MQAISRARRLQSLLKTSLRPSSARLGCLNDGGIIQSSCGDPQQISRYQSSYSALGSLRFSGLVQDNGLGAARHLIIPSASYSSSASTDADGPRDTVKELHEKILESVNTKRTMAPNAWTWSMIDNCRNPEDIKLLFDALEKLRRFRLSNLRIHENFNCHLCREVAKACVRVGALDFAKKTLWKHNVYGLTPSIASAHHLLSHAKQHNDAKLLEEVMKLVKRNDLPLQPGTADIVFSICYNTNNWDLLAKYSKRFVKAGVKLHRAAFDIWMNFAAKRGDVQSLWKIEELRSQSTKQHTPGTAIACAKGLLLEGKPDEAAAIVHAINESLPDTKQGSIVVELQKLVSEWPLEVIKHQKPEDRKALAAALKSYIPAMVNSLLNTTGLQVTVNMEDLIKAEEISA